MDNEEFTNQIENDKSICEDIIKNKLSHWKEVIEASFPQEISNKLLEELYVMLNECSLYRGSIHGVEKYEVMVSLLETAKNGSIEEVQNQYNLVRKQYGEFEVAGTFNCLADSYYAESFAGLLVQDNLMFFRQYLKLSEEQTIESMKNLVERIVKMTAVKEKNNDGKKNQGSSENSSGPTNQ